MEDAGGGRKPCWDEVVVVMANYFLVMWAVGVWGRGVL